VIRFLRCFLPCLGFVTAGPFLLHVLPVLNLVRAWGLAVWTLLFLVSDSSHLVSPRFNLETGPCAFIGESHRAAVGGHPFGICQPIVASDVDPV